MTSMPASRKARASTFAPRSCPSRPGFATRTRIGRSAIVYDSFVYLFCLLQNCCIERANRSLLLLIERLVHMLVITVWWNTENAVSIPPILTCSNHITVGYVFVTLTMQPRPRLLLQRSGPLDNLTPALGVDLRSAGNRQLSQHVLLNLRLHPFVRGIQDINVIAQKARIEQRQ